MTSNFVDKGVGKGAKTVVANWRQISKYGPAYIILHIKRITVETAIRFYFGYETIG